MKHKYFVIYKTTNKINGLIYIGKRTVFGSKPKASKSYLGRGVKIVDAVEKFGRTNFENIIIEYCDDREQLERQERYWISHLNATDPSIGYNILLGGTGAKGHKHTAASKRKMSKSGLGRKHSELAKKRMSISKRLRDAERKSNND